MHTASDNMLIDLALATVEAFPLRSTKYYDMRQFDRILFVMQYDQANGMQGDVSIINDTDGQDSDPKVLKVFPGQVIAGVKEVWCVEIKAEDLDKDHPFVRLDITTAPALNGGDLTVIAALHAAHYKYSNKLDADRVLKSWE